MCKNSHSTKITLISIFYNQIYQTFPDLKLELLLLLSYSAMFLFIGYTNLVYAQLTTLGVKIQSLPVDNAMIKDIQHSISYTSSSTTALSASTLKNPPSTQSITSIFSNNYQPSQTPPIANAGSNQVGGLTCSSRWAKQQVARRNNSSIFLEADSDRRSEHFKRSELIGMGVYCSSRCC
jgi:hypothetical protein